MSNPRPVALAMALARPRPMTGIATTVMAFRPLAQRALLRQPTTRNMSAIRAGSSLAHRTALQQLPGRRAVPSQQRWMNTNGVSRSLLATREATANRNPNSATAQNSFYQLLLKAGLPAIVVERYQSGLYASNDAADAAYFRALDMMQQAPTAGGVPSGEGVGTMDAEARQSAAQAVGARFAGKDVATSTVSTASDGRKADPLTVVVEESRGMILFKWVKTLLSLGITTYFFLLFFSMVSGYFDNADVYKRVGKGNKGEIKSEAQKTRFADVHGCDEAKEELQDVVEFLKNPKQFSTLGGKLPRGVLLVGPPGTGKTLLARAVAGESGVPFFYMSGSEFEEIYVGVGAKRVRELFAAAKKKAPAIIFIDEIDAVGTKRSSRDIAYMKQTLNQLLTEMDGFERDTGVIVLAATNHPKLLDRALTRPGRFDRHVNVSLPDTRGRLAILGHHAKNIKLEKGTKLDAIASRSSGLSGADLENLVNQAAVHASKAKKQAVGIHDLEWAMDKLIMGAEKRMVIKPKEKLMTAYHEAGHALVLLFADSPSSELHKVTILARGMSLGHTAFVPEMDKHSYTLADYLTQIRVAMGGLVAEELAFGPKNITSGVSADIESATQKAFAVVGRFAMSSKLAPMDYTKHYEHLSSETRALVEAEVQHMLKQSAEEVKVLLTQKRKELDLLARALVQFETLDKSEVEKVIRGEKLEGRIPLSPNAPLTIPVPDDGSSLRDGIASPGTERPPPAPAPPPTAP